MGAEYPDNAMMEYQRRVEAAIGKKKGLTRDQNLRRRQFEARADVFKSPYPEGMDVTNWYVALPGREVPIRIYRPAGDEGPRATIVYMHGGGYRSGSLDSHDTVVANLAQGTGAQVIAVHYRRAPENPYPAAVDDGYAILQWAVDNAEAWQIDPARLAIAGDSAGGGMTAALSMMARDRGGPALAMQILLYPGPMNPDTNSESYHRNGFDPGFNKEVIEFVLESYAGSVGNPDPYAVPLAQTDYAALPPAFIHPAEFDPILDDALVYGERLKAAGVPAEVRVAKNLLHSFLRAVTVSEEANAEAEYLYAAVRKGLDLPEPA